MMAIGWIGLTIGAVVIVAIVLYYAIWLRRTARRTGHAGLVQRSRLTCPKCRQTFDYDWVPGASFTAVRLGRGRYMACPLCGHWSRYDVEGHLIPPAAAAPPKPQAPH